MSNELCPECSGLGCDSCCFTGSEYTPQAPAQYTPCVGAPQRGQPYVAPQKDHAKRLSAALGALGMYDYETNDFVLRGTHNDVAAAIIAADPTLVCPDPAAHELAVAVAHLAETGRVEPYFYRTNAVYHALANRIHRGTPADDMVEMNLARPPYPFEIRYASNPHDKTRAQSEGGQD